MNFEPDAILERRRLRRRLSLWRIAAIVVALGAVALMIVSTADVKVPGARHIARLEVSGVIIDDEARDSAVLDLAEDKNAKALIVAIDSPGGTTSGSEGLYLALREVAKKKPVIAVMGSVAASGGYITAISADRIFARGNTITGSIGVLFQNTEISKLLDKVGVDVELVARGPLKGKPSPFEPLDDQGRKVLNTLIEDSYRWFVDLVAERRNLTREKALELADGRIYSGRQALEVKLIDQIGGQREALEWLEREKNISKDLPVHPVKYGEEDEFASLLLDSSIFRNFRKSLNLERLTLDGLVSLWHP
ncbi:MAG: signal peptide peptidase SppA [Pseudomonadota bacterium]|jgi:protease IV|nr:signal peptide peptidase SppA [Alphaproteobacteria bacterium]